MITIDLNEEFVSQPERPLNRKYPTCSQVDICKYDHVYAVIQKQHQDLLRASHNSKMLKRKSNAGLAVKVQRYFEQMRLEVFTLAERYTSRAG